jgi:hypothetical protein
MLQAEQLARKLLTLMEVIGVLVAGSLICLILMKLQIRI